MLKNKKCGCGKTIQKSGTDAEKLLHCTIKSREFFLKYLESGIQMVILNFNNMLDKRVRDKDLGLMGKDNKRRARRGMKGNPVINKN